MEEEKKVCKKCGKELTNLAETIFDGYCERCYNMWIGKKRKYMSDKNIKETEPTLTIYEFSCLCSVIGVAILVILSIILIPMSFFGTVNLITLFQSADILGEFSHMAGIFKVLIIAEICFSFAGLILGIISAKIYKSQKIKNIGLTLSIIEIVLLLILV